MNRTDAVKANGRDYVPTSNETRWVSTWQEFRNAGGILCFSEDQTRIELSLPAPFKFSIQFRHLSMASPMAHLKGE